MQEISQNNIKSYQNTYLSHSENRKLQQEYHEKSISEIAFQASKALQHPFIFSVDLPTMSAVSQGATGRCWIIAGLNLLREEAVKKMNREKLPKMCIRDSRRITKVEKFYSSIHLFLLKIHIRQCRFPLIHMCG